MIKKTMRAFLVPLVLAITSGGAQAITVNGIENGSFETGDYFGWTLMETGSADWGTWGIATNGQTINWLDETLDYCSMKGVYQFSPCLPQSYLATDGSYVAYHLQNDRQEYRMYQDVDIPVNASTLSWEMCYSSMATFGNDQYLAVFIRDPETDLPLLQDPLFMTLDGQDPLSAPMSTYSSDISMLAGQRVRISVELVQNVEDFPMSLDNFRIDVVDIPAEDPADTPPGDITDPTNGKTQKDKKAKHEKSKDKDAKIREQTKIPPGWLMGKKRGWQGQIPNLPEGNYPPGLLRSYEKLRLRLHMEE